MKKNALLAWGIVFISILYLFFVLFQNKTIYTRKFDYKVAKSAFEQSQWNQSQNFSESVELEKWAVSKGYTGWNNYVDENNKKIDIGKTKQNIIEGIKKRGISDAQLYTYAGYEYIHGKDPTLLNPEHPPLGKYLIGLSIVLFQNEHIILIIVGVVVLALLFLLVYLITSSLITSSFAVFLTATHSLFIDQLIYGPQLDIFQLAFLLLLMILLYFYEKKKTYTYLILGGICFGFLISIKTFVSYYIVFNIWLFIHFLFQKKNLPLVIKNLLIVNGCALLIFCLSYISFFLKGGNIRTFLGVQKYIFMFYRQSGINPLPYLGNYLRLIFTGSWKFWSQGSPITIYKQWSIIWILIFLAGIVASYKLIRQKKMLKNPFIRSLLIFSIVYNVFLFIFPIFPRYLLLLFVPYHVLISIYCFTYKQNEFK